MKTVNYIEGLEEDVVERLGVLVPHEYIRVHKAPETDAQRPEPSSVRANLFVMYSGSRYGDPRSTYGVSQDEFLQIAVVIESPFLRGDFGIYEVKKKVCDLLIGFHPKNSEVLTVVSAGYQAEKMVQNDGVFTFTVVFETRSLAVQAFVPVQSRIPDYDKEFGPEINKITITEPRISQEVDDDHFLLTSEEGDIFVEDDDYRLN